MSECKHLNSEIKGSEHLGFVTCKDCGAEVFLADVLNNFLEEMGRLWKEINNARTT